MSNEKFVVVLLLVLLACGPVEQLQELNHRARVLATGVATIREGNYSALDAYQNLDKLPGYHLESRTILRDGNGNVSTLLLIDKRDPQGNGYTLTQTSAGQQKELYIIEGHSYIYDPRYEGWVDTEAIAATGQEDSSSANSAEVVQLGLPLELLAQLGAVPRESGHEFIQGRSATRYELDYVIDQLAKTFAAKPANARAVLQGVIWVDDETGALLRSEILLYENGLEQPRQEVVLEVSQIGNIAPIIAPTPIVNPGAIVSATATAQAWSALQIKLNYQGEPLSFELTPIQISQESSLTARMQLLLRQLPPHLLSMTEAEPFLAQLGEQLTLSIPKKNLVVKSNGFQIETIDPENDALTVIYFFETELGDFSHVELILASPGNPVLAAVPVADNP
jgi:hypothetical protein